MKVPVYNQKGNKTKSTVDLADNIFGIEVNNDLMAQSLYIYQSNQRLGTQKTKGISEVRGGGRKPWRQKTPDRARHGSTRSPIWVGGGDAHPISPRNWRLRLSQKMRRGAIFSALSEKASFDLLKVVNNLKIDKGQLTRQVDEIYASLGEDKNLLIVTKEKNNELVLGAKSIKKVKVIMTGEINIFDIINSGIIVLTKDAAETMNNVWGDVKVEVKKDVKSEKTTETK